jgi:nucleotide-binding universal stress UspA family protein
MSGIKDGLEGLGDKMKAASKAAATKAKDPESDIDTEYQKEKMKEGTSEKSPAVSKLIPSSIPQYKRILVPDDRSESSDSALSHAIYLSNSTGAEIVVLNVIKKIDKIEPTTIEATSDASDEKNKGDIHITLKGQAEQMVEERIKQCKQAGAKNQVSYKMQTGKNLVDEILDISEQMNIDLIVMASSKVTSPIMGLTSATRKIIDGADRPVLVIHEE